MLKRVDVMESSTEMDQYIDAIAATGIPFDFSGADLGGNVLRSDPRLLIVTLAYFIHAAHAEVDHCP